MGNTEATKWFHFNSRGQIVANTCGSIEEARVHARRWNREEKRPGMTVETIGNSKVQAHCTRITAVS